MIKLLLILAATASAMVFAYPSHSPHWSHRSVILFAPTNDQQVEQFLLGALINKCELEERDVITLVVTEDGFSEPVWVKHEFNLQAMFEVYGVESGSYTSVLIGKDGTEKSRWQGELNWQQISRTIDGMPMRKREMAQKSNPCAI